jgi:hypothetical protein
MFSRGTVAKHASSVFLATPPPYVSPKISGLSPKILYLYCDERRDVRWNIAWAWGKLQGVFQGLRLFFIVFPDWSNNTDILNYNSSIDLPWISVLEELILRIALTTGQYGKLLASWLRNTEELNLNIKMFSNWEWKVLPFKCAYVSPVQTVKVVKTLQR